MCMGTTSDYLMGDASGAHYMPQGFHSREQLLVRDEVRERDYTLGLRAVDRFECSLVEVCKEVSNCRLERASLLKPFYSLAHIFRPNALHVKRSDRIAFLA